MKVAILSSIAWRTPPRRYGPWEQVASTLAEGLIDRGVDVTLFATGDSITKGKLEYACEHPYAENSHLDPKVWECLHISRVMELAHQFDIIHNHFDFLPLTYSQLIDTPLVTTIHGFSSPQILPVYRKYDDSTDYISISDSDRHPDLHYLRTIYHGVNPDDFEFSPVKENYLLSFGRVSPEKGTHTAIEIAKRVDCSLRIAGIIQDQNYFNKQVAPYLDKQITYVGNADPAQRNKLLKNARALLHPIDFEEPFGLSVAEAMMCGTPVIAFDRGSMPELILDGATGYLVNDIEGAVVAVGNLPRIQPAACRAHAEKTFGVNRMIDDYIDAYATVLDRRK